MKHIQFPSRASTVIKLILRCKPQNTGVSSSKVIQTSSKCRCINQQECRLNKWKEPFALVHAHTNCYRTIRARARVCVRARACVRLMTVNVCLCLRRRACEPVSDECAHVCALGKAHTHKTRKTHKKHGRLELQGTSNVQANADV